MLTMEIILTGGGDSKHFKQIDRRFKKILPAKSNILLFPVATNRRNHQYCLRRIHETFFLLKFNKIDVCSDLDKLSKSHIDLFHAFYIDGGNTFKLIQQARESSFKKFCKYFLERGGIINADSAGAICLGKNIKTALIGKIADKNTVNIKNFIGMNLLFNHSVHCHFDIKNEEDELKSFSIKHGPTLALTEKTAVYIKNKKLQVIGLSPLYYFKNGKIKIINPKEEIKLC